MRGIMKILCIAFLSVFLGSLIAACTNDSDDETQCASSDPLADMRLHLLTAQNGTLLPAPEGHGNDYVLVLENVGEQIVWFSDRPMHETGDETVTEFVETTWPCVYAGLAPNAFMEFEAPDVSSQTAFSEESIPRYAMMLMLRSPQYQPNESKVTFQARLLDTTLDGSSTAAQSFENIMITIMDNEPEDQQKSGYSFAQTAAGALLEPTDMKCEYSLTLTGLMPEMTAVENAPGRDSHRMTVSSFVTTWDNRFVDSTPNASLKGMKGNEPELFVLTLMNPFYADDTVAYDAILLGEGTCAHIEPVEMDSVSLFIDGSGSRIPLPPYGVDFGDVNTAYTGAEITAAVDEVAQYFDLIRTYDSLHGKFDTFMNASKANKLQVILGIDNGMMATHLGSNNDATNYVDTYVYPYKDLIKVVLIGNEVAMSGWSNITNYPTYVKNLMAAMRNYDTGTKIVDLLNEIAVSSTIGPFVVQTWPDVKQCFFNSGDSRYTRLVDGYKEMLNQRYPVLFLNLYPFLKAGDTGKLDTRAKMVDEFSNWLFPCYSNAIDAAGLSAMELCVGETGWATDEGNQAHTQDTSVHLANEYINAYFNDVKNIPTTMFFEMYDEPDKPGVSCNPPDACPWEAHFGLFKSIEVGMGSKAGMNLPNFK